jgi:hypothetical protein
MCGYREIGGEKMEIWIGMGMSERTEQGGEGVWAASVLLPAGHP